MFAACSTNYSSSLPSSSVFRVGPYTLPPRPTAAASTTSTVQPMTHHDHDSNSLSDGAPRAPNTSTHLSSTLAPHKASYPTAFDDLPVGQHHSTSSFGISIPQTQQPGTPLQTVVQQLESQVHQQSARLAPRRRYLDPETERIARIMGNL